MDGPIYRTLRAAMNHYVGDDLERAEMEWGEMVPADLAKEHGQSGRSRGEILGGYREARASWKRADRWLEARKP